MGSVFITANTTSSLTDGAAVTKWSALIFDEASGEVCRKGDADVPIEYAQVLQETDDAFATTAYDPEKKTSTIRSYVLSPTGAITKTDEVSLHGAADWIRGMSPDKRFFYATSWVYADDHSGKIYLHSYERVGEVLVERGSMQAGEFGYYLTRSPARFKFSPDGKWILIGDSCGCSHWYYEHLTLNRIDVTTGLPYDPHEIAVYDDATEFVDFAFTSDSRYLYILESLNYGFTVQTRAFSLSRVPTELDGSPFVAFDNPATDQPWTPARIHWISKRDTSYVGYTNRDAHAYRFEADRALDLGELVEDPAITTDAWNRPRTLTAMPSGRAMIGSYFKWWDGSGRDHWVTYVRDAAGKYKQKYDYAMREEVWRIAPR